MNAIELSSTSLNRRHLSAHHLPLSIVDHDIFCGVNPELPPIRGTVLEISPTYAPCELHSKFTLTPMQNKTNLPH